ncbi:MAG: Hsp20/alpha crystallin family protein [Ignavibacteria bacterium]|nr:MAG: Hsp20/alpha crystallin family protein [Ignavibacteria bacterium]
MFNYGLDTFTESLEKSDSKNSKKYLPLLDVYENGEKFIVELELPGITKENLRVKLEDGELLISAKRIREDGINPIHSERYFGEIERRVKFHVPISEEDIKAKLEDGLLKIELKKIENKKEIKIN